MTCAGSEASKHDAESTDSLGGISVPGQDSEDQ